MWKLRDLKKEARMVKKDNNPPHDPKLLFSIIKKNIDIRRKFYIILLYDILVMVKIRSFFMGFWEFIKRK